MNCFCRTLVVVLANLGAFAAAQEGSEPVTATCHGARLSVALQLLGKEAKLDLKASPALAEAEIVAFRFKDVPIGVAMKKLAAAVDGLWERSAESWILGPDVVRRQAQLQADRRKKLESVRKQLNEILNPPKPKVDPNKKKTEDEEAFPEEYERSNSDKAIARMLLTTDLSLLVDMPDQGRIVYSPTPNPRQRPMRVDMALIKKVIDDHNQSVAMSAEARKNQEVEIDAGSEKYREWMKKMGMDREEVPLKGAPSKILLVAERGSFMGDSSLQTTLKIYDAEGKTVISVASGLYLGDGNFMMPMVTDVATAPGEAKEQQPTPPDPKSPKIEWSPLAKEFESYSTKMQAMMMSGGMPEMPAAIRDAMAKPDEIEPLSLGVGEGLVRSAELSGKQIVALLPDDSFQSGFGQGTLPTTVARFMQGFKAMPSMILKEDGDWWSVAAKDPISARKERANRPTLGVFLRQIGSNQMPSLDELSAFAAKNESPFKSDVAGAYLMLGAPGLMRYMFDTRQWDTLRLYGQLDSAQKAGLAGGRRLEFGSLTMAQTATVERLLYGANPTIMLGPTEEDTELGGILGLMSYGMMEGRSEADYRQEPTELCPNGLPARGFVSMKVKADYIIKPVKGGGWMQMMGSSGLQEFAMYQMMRENPAMAEAAMMPEVKEVLVGSRRDMTLTFQLAPDASVRRSLQDDKIPTDAKPVSTANLPADVKAALEKAMVALKKLDMPFLDPSMFGGGRQVIPPQ